MYTHAVDSRADLLKIRYVGAHAQSSSAGMFDLEVGKVELRFASGEESDAASCGCESDRQPLPDSASGAGYKHTRVLQTLQGVSILPNLR
jgi:hypothetical protein